MEVYSWSYWFFCWVGLDDERQLKVKKIKKNIKSNETKTSEVDGKIKYIKKKKKSTKKKIADTNRELKELKKKKPVVKNKNPRKATLAIKKRLKKK